LEKEKIVQLLTAIKSTCSHASLTGCLGEGRLYLISVYNELLPHINTILAEQSIPNLFKPLSSEASMDEVGCAAILMLSVLE